MRRVFVAAIAVLFAAAFAEAQVFPLNSGYPMTNPSVADPAHFPVLETDFVNAGASQNMPFAGGALATGTAAVASGLANHPGLLSLRSHATNANSGYYWITGTAFTLISGTEYFEAAFRVDRLTDVTAYIGYIDTTTAAESTDGVYITIPSTGALVGTTSAASSRTNTTTSYTVSTATWYRVRAEVNADATLVTYYLYSEAGALLWAASVASNIPKTAGQETGAGALVFHAAAGPANDLLTLDYLGFGFTRALTR